MGFEQRRPAATHEQWEQWAEAVRQAVRAMGMRDLILRQLRSANYVQAVQQDAVVEWIQATYPHLMEAIRLLVEHVADLTRPNNP
jgi:hypothetical protein